MKWKRKFLPKTNNLNQRENQISAFISKEQRATSSHLDNQHESSYIHRSIVPSETVSEALDCQLSVEVEDSLKHISKTDNSEVCTRNVLTRCPLNSAQPANNDCLGVGERSSAATLVAAQCVEAAEAIGAKLRYRIVAANVENATSTKFLQTNFHKFFCKTFVDVAYLCCFNWMYSINPWNAGINTGLSGITTNWKVPMLLLQNEATVDLFAAKIQIHKQPLDVADYILIGIEMSVVKVFNGKVNVWNYLLSKTSSLQDCQPRLP
ncbi:reverse transcriptase domain-containing protein [Tanacetum coccineum]|uniref:Reverse transcriptase domain-containing protein n=1 Tax=Tanacetum coccineum TaxID=301880 RepID=A0ABQ5G6L1_9ASTR